MIRHSGFLFAFMVLMFSMPGVSQTESTISPVIEAADVKKLMKANSYKENADKLIEEASQLNMDALSVLADPSLDEKSAFKKSAQLESQAREKQTLASAQYEKCNEIKFSVYRTYIDAFWKKHPDEESANINAKLLEEQASDQFFQAVSYRIEAKKMADDLAKVEKLTQANELEGQAIQKQVMVIADCYRLASALQETAPTAIEESPEPFAATTLTTETTLPEQLSVNQERVAQYNRYISEGQYTDTTLSTGRLAGLTAFEADTILQLWHNYVYGHDRAPGEEVLAQLSDTSEAATGVEPAKTTLSEGETAEIGVVTDENKAQLIPADGHVIYRVQIAANRTELSQRALSRMYYGNKSVEMINEGGWYKYSVGDFETYEEASKFRKSSGVSNAYIVAYRKGTRFVSPSGTEASQASAVAHAPAGLLRLPAGLIFRVQVAASRVPFSMDQFRRIYTGNYPIEMIVEEGWYKYQFMGVRLYSDALRIKQGLNVKGAFIVAYDDGVKANLAHAIAKNRETEKLLSKASEIEFHLQLAASRIPMKTEEILALYDRPEEVAIILEDGWFKYHLKAGNSTSMVQEFKQNLNIPKAFIVPYRKAAKITYYEAIHNAK